MVVLYTRHVPEWVEFAPRRCNALVGMYVQEKYAEGIVKTQPNINLTQLRLRLDTIINSNLPHLHKLVKLAIWETSNR